MIILKTCCNGKCTHPLICKTDYVCLTELPAFVLSRTAKQTAPCQSAGHEPQKRVGLFRYSYILVAEKIYFELGEENICRSSSRKRL